MQIVTKKKERETEKERKEGRKEGRSGMAMLLSHKINFKSKTITRGKGGHYMLITSSIYQEHRTPINIYVPNNPQICEANIDRIEGRNR